MELSSGDDPDGVVNLEKTVLAVLSKLSKTCRNAKSKYNSGVSCKSIAEFLQANYCWVDGDVESQVMTALLSCIKAGLVCSLVSGRYRLIGANVREMPARCVLRPCHGPKCSCLNTLKCFSKSYSQVCCILENKSCLTKKKNKCTRKRNLGKTITLPPPKGAKRRVRWYKPKSCCVQAVRVSNASMAEEKDLLQVNSTPPKDICMNCFPPGERSGGNIYKGFSPGDELSRKKPTK